MRRVLFLSLALLLSVALRAEDAGSRVTHDLKIHFHQGKINLDPNLKSNPQTLRDISDSLYVGMQDSVLELRAVQVYGSASPEGSVKLNQYLSERRANVLFDYLSRYGELPDSVLTFTFIGRDWKGLLERIEKDPNMPNRHETMTMIRDIIARSADGERESDDNVNRLRRLRGGVPYNYMYRNHFPELRASRVTLTYEKVWNPTKMERVFTNIEIPSYGEPFENKAIPELHFDLPEGKRPFYWALKTNMLYDALAVPNIGAEVYLGKNLSLGANWMYAWWKTDRHHWYWRTYGGDIALRYWFGKKASIKPLQGHHIGLYAQMLTYDFETGGKGQIGGVPGGTLWDEMHWGAGVEYGYSLPVSRHFNIDFSIGLGYLGGQYWEYTPEDDCYVWKATKQRHWFGPTKAEISLVWLLGRGNFNRGKGGQR